MLKSHEAKLQMSLVKTHRVQREKRQVGGGERGEGEKEGWWEVVMGEEEEEAVKLQRKRERDKGDSSSKIRRGYTGGGGRQVIEEEEEEGNGYGGDVRNINRGSGLPAGAHSAPNTYCHSD